MNDFLPASYEIPVTSDYMRLEDGANKFRILDKAVVGMTFWKTVEGKRKQIFRRMGELINPSELEISQLTGRLENPKHFWAFPVYNYATKKIEILVLTQTRVQKSLLALVDSPDWGDPKEYDITITRVGQKQDTNYAVMPSPKRVIDPGVESMHSKTFINMENLFAGKNAFEAQNAGDMTAVQVENAVTSGKHTETIDSNDIPF